MNKMCPLRFVLTILIYSLSIPILIADTNVACRNMTKLLDGSYCYEESEYTSTCSDGKEQMKQNISVNLKEIGVMFNWAIRKRPSFYDCCYLIVNKLSEVSLWTMVNYIGIVSYKYALTAGKKNYATCFLRLQPPEVDCRSTFVLDSHCGVHESNCGQKITRKGIIEASGENGRKCFLNDEKESYIPCQNCYCRCWIVPKIEVCNASFEQGTMFKSVCTTEHNGYCHRKAEYETSSCSNTNQFPNETCLNSKWSDWSKCSASCGIGTKYRSRQRFDCPNETVQCLNFDYDCDSCEILYSNWSDCSEKCGGRGRQQATVMNISGNSCPSVGYIQQRNCPDIPCPENCTLSDWTEWGLCDKSCGNGTRSRSRVIERQGVFNGTNCDPSTILFENKDCYGEFRECQKNCTLSDWTMWSPCSRSCISINDEGYENRTKTVIQQSTVFAKKKCPSPLPGERRSCQDVPRCRSKIGLEESEESDISLYLILVGGFVMLVISLSLISVCFSYNKRRKSNAQIFIERFERSQKQAREKVKRIDYGDHEKILPITKSLYELKSTGSKSKRADKTKKDLSLRYEHISVHSLNKEDKNSEKSSRYEKITFNTASNSRKSVVHKGAATIWKDNSFRKAKKQQSGHYEIIPQKGPSQFSKVTKKSKVSNGNEYILTSDNSKTIK